MTQNFDYKEGCNISSTLTIEKMYMNITEAKLHAQKLENCVGFSVENNKTPVEGKEYLCHFKEGNGALQDGMKRWHTYLCPVLFQSFYFGSYII